MRNMMFLILFIGLCLLGCCPAMAASFKNGGKFTNINIEVGKVTEIVFPDKVAKIIKGGQGDSILVEVLDHSVYVLPKTEHPPDIFVTTVTGSSYPLQFHLAKDHDIKVEVIPFSSDHRNSSTQGTYTDVMDLMKDLLLDKEPAGATLLPSEGSVLLSDHQIQLKVDKAYELIDWKAYVLTARNITSNAVIIPIEQMTLPGLLAVSTNRDMLSAQGQEGDSTQVYLITSQ